MKIKFSKHFHTFFCFQKRFLLALDLLYLISKSHISPGENRNVSPVWLRCFQTGIRTFNRFISRLQKTMTAPCPEAPPDGFLLTLHLIGGISLLMNLLTMYMIWFESPGMHGYRYCLTYVQVGFCPEKSSLMGRDCSLRNQKF